ILQQQLKITTLLPYTTLFRSEERINEMYLLLEKEAIAKNYVVSQYSNYMDQVAGAITEFEETKSEVEQLKQSYYFDDRDLEKYLDRKSTRLNSSHVSISYAVF